MKNKSTFIFLTILIFMCGVSVCMVINLLRENTKKYEYYKNGQFGTSNKCYYDNKIQCVCNINGTYEQVESYYRVVK